MTDNADSAIGASKLGGKPDLPFDFVWPQANGQYLAFIAQLNLHDFKTYDIEKRLPGQGMLYFFYNNDQQPWGYDPADRDHWRVYHVDVGISELVRTDFPDELGPEGGFEPGVLSFYREDTIPGWNLLLADQLGFDSEESDLYCDLTEEINGNEDDIIHRVLGYPQELQDGMQLQCQLVTNGIYCGNSTGYEDPRREELEAGAGQWQLLFQVSSEEDLGMMWGDMGRLYFWITEESLNARDFDKVWLILQCG